MNKKHSISVIIPTYNRPESLIKTLKTTFSQTTKVDEILIIDDSSDNRTHELLKKLKKKIKKPSLIYIKKIPSQKGVARSRNLGIDKARGDLIFFLDDDITIHSDYVESTVQFFDDHPNATAVQWFAYSDHDYKYDYGKIKNLLMKLFLLGYYKKDKSLILPSMNAVVPFPLTRDIETQYMGAGTMVIKKKYLGSVKFDETLKNASIEDLDFSYRFYKKYGNTYLLKDRKLHHDYSLVGRTDLKKVMFRKFIYLAYIFKKSMPQDFLHLLAFWWSTLGRIFLRVINLGYSPSKKNLEEFKYTFQAIGSLLVNFSRIEKDPNYFERRM